MTACRLLHSSDRHLGRAFANFPECIRHRLREARHGAIARLAAAARFGGAATILLAGDTFDAETPAPETLRQALAAMREAADITWVLLPGNHDSLAATELWRRIATDGPANLRALTTDAPVELAAGVWLLPAPCTQRRPGRDLTESMLAATPTGARRIGLGHGAITDFSGEEGATGIIPLDRAQRSGLDYLALGDWRGQLRVSPTMWYSGTPEPDGFKHEYIGAALLRDRERGLAARRDPLSSVAGEIDMMTGGRRMDLVIDRVTAALAVLATDGGRPKANGEWKRALDQVEALVAREGDLRPRADRLSCDLARRSELQRSLARLTDPEVVRHPRA